MPTYQYRCSDCGNELEAVQKFTDAALTECPTCNGSLRKVFNAVGVVFKGSGFYRTDSRADQKKSGGSGGSSKSDRSDKSDSTRSDSAAEKKPATTEKKSESSGSKKPVAAGSSSGSGSSGGGSSTAA